MIDEAMGKILGMVMAYGASALGMWVAYVNYRRRILGAEKLMTPAAWGVILLTVLAFVGGAVVVAQLVGGPALEAPVVERAGEAEPARVEVAVPPLPEAGPPEDRERNRWPLSGIVVPAVIFLTATVVTTALHRRFSTHGH